MEDKKGAIENFDLAIKLSPDYYQAYYYKGAFLSSIERNK